jgi:hypothetical protein
VDLCSLDGLALENSAPLQATSADVAADGTRAPPAPSSHRGAGLSTDSGFTRWYVVPGLRWGFADRLDLLVEGGVGLNDNSPSYVTVGIAAYMPVANGAQRNRR